MSLIINTINNNNNHNAINTINLIDIRVNIYKYINIYIMYNQLN